MPRPTTEDLQGMEGEGVSRRKIKAVETASDNYVEVRDKRMKLTEQEVEARAVLIQKMRDNNITEYVYDDHKVLLVPGKDKVKVRTIDGDGDGLGDDE